MDGGGGSWLGGVLMVFSLPVIGGLPTYNRSSGGFIRGFDQAAPARGSRRARRIPVPRHSWPGHLRRQGAQAARSAALVFHGRLRGDGAGRGAWAPGVL